MRKHEVDEGESGMMSPETSRRGGETRTRMTHVDRSVSLLQLPHRQGPSNE